jgi:DNA-binding GntR family transcriptional regulator
MSPDPQPLDVFQRLEETPPLRERVHDQLESLITSGAFLPGTRLVEGELAANLGVSRGPIREALQLLWRDGLVDLRPRQGAFVHAPDQKEVDDFFDIRRALESESARLAAMKITAEGGAEIRSSLELARQQLEHGDDPSAVGHQVKFHDVITAIADNPVLAQMLGTLGKRTVWYRSPYEPALRRKAWDEHEAIGAAIIGGDSATAMSLMAEHIGHARDHLKDARDGAT